MTQQVWNKKLFQNYSSANTTKIDAIMSALCCFSVLCGSSPMRPAAYNCCSPQQVTWLKLSMCAAFLQLSFWTSRVAGEHPEPAFCLFSVRHIWLYSPTSSLEVGRPHAYSWATLMISLHLMFWSHD